MVWLRTMVLNTHMRQTRPRALASLPSRPRGLRREIGRTSTTSNVHSVILSSSSVHFRSSSLIITSPPSCLTFLQIQTFFPNPVFASPPSCINRGNAAPSTSPSTLLVTPPGAMLPLKLAIDRFALMSVIYSLIWARWRSGNGEPPGRS
jgi:hypothetical protein